MKELRALLLKLVHEMGKEGTLPITVLESSITLKLKLHKDPTKQKNYKPIIFMNTTTKILSKICAN